MPKLDTIFISPSGSFSNESEMINRFFDVGLYRYHIHKFEATEQSIAEILERVKPKYLGQITLHSHFHLVLAYGVGGIHYSQPHRVSLGDDYPSKVGLYQSFGIKVSTDLGQDDWSPADYALSTEPQDALGEVDAVFPLMKDVQSLGSKRSHMLLEMVLKKHSKAQVIDALT